MEKNYQNNNLIRYFEKFVATMEVEEDFKPLLVDILLRRAFEYSLTPQQIQQDMNSLLFSLKSIEIGKMSKGNERTLRIIFSKKEEDYFK